MTPDDIHRHVQDGTLTETDAIAFVNERLGEMFDGVNEPPVDQPPHITLVNWVSALADWRRKGRRVEAATTESAHLLRDARKSLQAALGLLDKVHLSGQGLYRCTKCKATEPFGGNAEHNGAHACGGFWRAFDFGVYDRTFGDEEVCKCGHPYYRHFDTYQGMEPVGCKYCFCDMWQPPTDRLVRDPHGEKPASK